MSEGLSYCITSKGNNGTLTIQGDEDELTVNWEDDESEHSARFELHSSGWASRYLRRLHRLFQSIIEAQEHRGKGIKVNNPPLKGRACESKPQLTRRRTEDFEGS